jgi:hypothetical protein
MQCPKRLLTARKLSGALKIKVPQGTAGNCLRGCCSTAAAHIKSTAGKQIAHESASTQCRRSRGYKAAFNKVSSG